MAEQKKIDKIVKDLCLNENVFFYAEKPDISDLFQQASIHLLTSITESFCLVIAEAKYYGIPTVMYEIPFLELVQGNNNGLIQVKRWDRMALAKAVINLLNDKSLLDTYSKQAKESIANFNPQEVYNSWCRIFNQLNGDNSQVTQKHENEIYYRTIINEIYNAWNYNCKKNAWKIQFFDNVEKILGFSLRSSINGIEKFASMIINTFRKIK